MSVQRTFAQHNNNKTSLLPVRYSQDLSIENITNAAIYTINISKAEYVGGIHIVDLSQPDSSGNALDLSGTFTSLTDLSGFGIPIVCFGLNIDTVASAYPGKEITIFFKNIPFNSISPPFLTIGLLANSFFTEESPPIPYILSAPFPPAVGSGISPSITLKSDGDKFNVVSSGPAGWLGLPALSAILTVFESIPL